MTPPANLRKLRESEFKSKRRGQCVSVPVAYFDAMVAEIEAWRLVDSEHRDNNPCPDPCLRKNYLDRARAKSAALDALLAGMEDL